MTKFVHDIVDHIVVKGVNAGIKITVFRDHLREEMKKKGLLQ